MKHTPQYSFLTVEIDDEIHEALERRAEEEGITVNDLIESALIKFLDNNDAVVADYEDDEPYVED